MTTPVEYGSASVIDIITYGYRMLFKQTGALLKLLILPVLITSIPIGYFNQMSSHKPTSFSPEIIVMLVAFVLSMLLISYMSYVLIRFTRDVFAGSVSTNLMSYMRPRRDLLGYIALLFVIMGVGILAIIPIILGFILLVIPGVILSLCFISYVQLCYISYFQNPGRSLMAAVKEPFGLIRANWLRVSVLGFVAYVLVQVVIQPFNMINVVIAVLAEFNPSVGQAAWLLPAYCVSAFLVMLATFFFHTCGANFVMYRLYFDLVARRDGVAIVPSSTSPEVSSASASTSIFNPPPAEGPGSSPWS